MTEEYNSHPEPMDASQEATQLEESLEEAQGETEDEEIDLRVEEEELDEVAALKKELDETRLKRDEYLDGWQRARAEFANYKKRVEREREQVRRNVFGTIIRRYLDIVDDLERALDNRPQDGEGATWAGGIELICRKMRTSLEADEVKTMDADGVLFDPSLHEAISQEESPDHESGYIIEVVETGYLIGDRVLRPAKVRVAQ